MSKVAYMKKSLLREGAILAVVLAITGGLVFGLDTYVSSKDQESHKLQGSMQALTSQTAELEKKIGLVQSSIEEYQRLKAEMAAKRYSPDREQAKLIIDQMRQDFRLSNLKIEISPETPFDDGSTKYVVLEPTYRDLKITFSAITDLHVYAFIEELPKRLPGFLKPAGVTIHREKPLTNDILEGIAKGDEPPMVSAELHYLWAGIRAKPKPDTGGPHAPL